MRAPGYHHLARAATFDENLGHPQGVNDIGNPGFFAIFPTVSLGSKLDGSENFCLPLLNKAPPVFSAF